MQVGDLARAAIFSWPAAEGWGAGGLGKPTAEGESRRPILKLVQRPAVVVSGPQSPSRNLCIRRRKRVDNRE